MLAKVAIFLCGWLLALSTALPLGHIGQQAQVPRNGFATAKHALIIGCDGFGKNLSPQVSC
jgi:hypothetical protein